MYKSLAEIERIVTEMSQIINAHERSLPTYGYSADYARPHIEINTDGSYEGYNYIVVERGEEISRLNTKSLHEFLYTIFNDITLDLAVEFGKNNRVIGQDFRRLMWAHQLELLNKLNPLFTEKLQREIDEILDKHPYLDQ